MVQTASNLIGKRVRVIDNKTSGSFIRSYTHGETGMVMNSLGEWITVKMDNTKKYGKPYRYLTPEVQVVI